MYTNIAILKIVANDDDKDTFWNKICILIMMEIIDSKFDVSWMNS